MDKENLKKEIIKEIDRIPEWKGSDNWSNVRSSRVLSQESSSDLYEGMQASRGLSLSPDLSFDDNINLVVNVVNSELLPQDKERHEEILSNIDMAKIDNVLELGSAYGYFTIQLSKLSKRGTIYAVEPNTDYHENYLTKNIEINKLK